MSLTRATKIQEYISSKFGAFVCWSFATFAGNDFPGGNQDPNIFAPTNLNAQGFIDEWLDTFMIAGMGYAVFDAKTNDGWCLWPTAFADPEHDPYSITETTWYVNAGSPDLVKMFVDGCVERGLMPVIYFSVLDTTHEARTETDEVTDAASYIAMLQFQLTELLTNYPNIEALWLDGYKWHIAYADIPYSVCYNAIKAVNSSCLVINNEHDYELPISTDIMTHELVSGADSETDDGNINPSEDLDSIRVDQAWNYNDEDDQTATAFRGKSYINAARARTAARTATYCITITPDYAGHIPAAQKAILESLQT